MQISHIDNMVDRPLEDIPTMGKCSDNLNDAINRYIGSGVGDIYNLTQEIRDATLLFPVAGANS